MKTIETKFSVQMTLKDKISFMFEVFIGVTSLPMILLTTLCGFTVFIEVKPNKK
jgi:hypothetical protein